jgi:hypothetical protein
MGSASSRLRLAALVAAFAFGCGDDDSTAELDGSSPTGEQKADGGVTTPVQGIDASTRQPLYAINLEVYSGDDSTTYVTVLNSLDVPSIDTSKAIEFTGGRANIAVNDGKLFVAVPGQPVIRRYAVEGEGAYKPDGELSLSNYGSDPAGLDEWANIFISPTKAYLAYADAMIVWNPSSMQIVKEIDLSKLPPIPAANWSRDGSGMIKRGNRVYRTSYFSDWVAFDTSRESWLLAFDTDTDTLLSAELDSRCPSLGNRPDSDEQGNLYFSNWVWNVGETIRKNAPKSCVLRLPAGSDKFDDWQLTYSDLTQGREGAMFAYLGNGTAVFSAFHLENGKNDPAATISELISQDIWQLYSVNLATRTATLVPGVPVNSGATSTYHLDGRNYTFLPTEGWGKTHAYELLGTGPVNAVKRWEAPGWSYQAYRLR